MGARGGNKPGTVMNHYTLDGEWKTIAELAEMAGISDRGMWYRLKVRGLTPEEALKIPFHSKGRYMIDGEYVTCREAQKKLYLHYTTVIKRAKRAGRTTQEQIDLEWAALKEGMG